MFSELVPSVYIGVVELSIEYFLFIPLSLAMLFDPNGLMWFGVSETFSFSLSYAYRILPMLMEEFQSILLSFRLRGNPPKTDNLKGKLKFVFYQIQVVMNSFYPLMLNTAKRSRTTVEALELKGYRYAATNKKIKKMKLKSLKITYDDLIFIVISFTWVMISILFSTIIKRGII